LFPVWLNASTLTSLDTVPPPQKLPQARQSPTSCSAFQHQTCSCSSPCILVGLPGLFASQFDLKLGKIPDQAKRWVVLRRPIQVGPAAPGSSEPRRPSSPERPPHRTGWPGVLLRVDGAALDLCILGSLLVSCYLVSKWRTNRCFGKNRTSWN
jgi:hypothetical protein